MKFRLIAAAAASAIAFSACGGSDDNNAPVAATPKNIVFFLGDGMGLTTQTAARIYKVGEAGDLTMDTLPETAFVRTYSNNAQVTDSAPSMAAYMTGVKMNNEVISMTPETSAFDAAGKDYLNGTDSTCPQSGNGKPVTTLLEIAKAAGMGTGAVTTTRITHATPAATFSHICHRDGENNIAAQAVPGGAGYNGALGDGVDVLLGGGRQFFLPATAGGKRTDGRDLTAELKAKGYTYVQDKAGFDGVATTTKKLVGLFTSSHMAYDIDRDASKEPSLAEMTGKAIDLLGQNPKGFFLMVEGGRIDHALHETTARKALQDTVAFDDAIKAAIDKMQAKDPGLANTLIVVTADHDHTMTFNGYSHKGNPILGKTTDIKPTTVQGKPVLAKAADGLPYTTLVFGNGGGPRKATRDDVTSVDTAADDYLQEVSIPLGAPGSETHGGGDVMLFSTGAGSAPFKGTMVNTKVFGLVKSALGL